MKKLILVLLAGSLFALNGCATKPAVQQTQRSHAPEMVVGKLWGWEGTTTSVEQFTSPDPKRFSIRLMPGGKAQVTLDCNRGGGNYQIQEGKLSFSPLFSTKMACPTQDKPLDHHFGKQLQQIASYFVENGMLYLEMPMDGGTMKFKELAP